MFIDPKALLAGIDDDYKTPERQEEERLEQFFWDIEENWVREADVDYSLTLDELYKIIENAPQYILHRLGAAEIAQDIFKELSLKKTLQTKRRIL